MRKQRNEGFKKSFKRGVRASGARDDDVIIPFLDAGKHPVKGVLQAAFRLVSSDAASDFFPDRESDLRLFDLAFNDEQHEKPVLKRGAVLINIVETSGTLEPVLLMHLRLYAQRTFLPLARLLARTFLPPLVAILARKPWTLLLCLFLG